MLRFDDRRFTKKPSPPSTTTKTANSPITNFNPHDPAKNTPTALPEAQAVTPALLTVDQAAPEADGHLGAD